MSGSSDQQESMQFFIFVIVGLCALFYFAPEFTRGLIRWVFHLGWTGRHPIFGW